MKRLLSLLVLLWAVTGFAQTIRINSGGAAYTDGAGNAWLADVDFSGGAVHTTTATIAGTTSQPLFQTSRYGTMTYTIPVSNADYNVNLSFAEPYWTAVGQRVFSVKINGVQVLTNFDIIAKAGANNTADIESFPVTVTTGSIVIQFLRVTDYPLICAIEILPTAPPPPPLSVAVVPSASTVPTNGTATFTATVSNDSANAGVTWSAQYGSILPTSSGSGVQVTYTAPPTVPAGGSDTVTATSVTDPTKSASSIVTVQHSVSLTWQDTVNPAGTTYNVMRATAPCGTAYTQLASVSALSYVDTSVVLGTTYCYQVQAVLNGVTSGFPLVVTVNVQ